MPELRDAKPLRLSWSRVRAHTECHAKGELLAQGRKSPLADISGYFHGTVVDICMRTYLRADVQVPGSMRAMVDEVFDKAEKDAKATGDGVVRWKAAGEKDEKRELCREMVTQLEPLLDRMCLPYEWDPAIRFAVPMTIPYGNSLRPVTLVGETDLLVRMKDVGTIVWDLKATRDPSYWRKVTGQLLFYEIAIAAMTGAWPYASGLIQPMCEDQLPLFRFTDQERREMLTRICAVAADIWQGRIEPKVDNAGCQRCEVRPSCPKFARTRVSGRVAGVSILG